jgi:peptidoglycan/xylan/chitin deacetylase (PgdA/CDA1 family)
VSRECEERSVGGPQHPPRFVVSQDFELHWGVRDKRSVEEYRANLLGVRRAIPETLRLFEKFEIHATWATVGFLFFDGRDELMANLPEVLPAYENQRYSPYGGFGDLGRSETEDPFHFAPSLLRLIAQTPGQEIGTHTFSHFYCMEPGNDERAFEADIRAAQRAAERFGVRLRSLVFPRNQVNEEYLPLCAKLGIRAYRGTPSFAAYRPRTNELNGWLTRAGRLADNYLPLSGHNSFCWSPNEQALPLDVPASFFLRPHSRRLAALEPLRQRRILRDLSFAAERGHTYHLWWHPHNFGTHLQENLAFLTRILVHVAELRSKYGMQSVNMGELADSYDQAAKVSA